MNILSIILRFIFWLGVIPFLVGIVPAFVFEKKKKRIGTIYMAGWIFMTAIFQLIAVPFVVGLRAFSDLEAWYSIIIIIIAILSAIVLIICAGTNSVIDFVELPSVKKLSRNEVIGWIIFGLLLAFQIVMSLVWMTLDGDDAYYVTVALIADKKDVMYLENPYTGIYNNLEYRHILAPFSMFIGFIARKLELHATIVAHSILPPVFIGITYLIYFKICQALFPTENEKQPIFMIIISALQIFGGTSLYTREVFFLTRTWQGKSVLANIVLPFVFYLLLQLCRQTEKEEFHRYRLLGIYILLFLANFAGALASSLGLLLLLIMEASMFVLVAVRNKKPVILLEGLPTLLPCFIYMFLYVVMK